MDELHLSDTLQRYFSDIFLCYDEEKTGEVSVTKTIELIKTGNIPEDIVSQISDICWNQCTNYLNVKQFFAALKLVAAYQAKIPLRNEIITSKIDLPLPRFSWTIIENTRSIPDLIELQDLNNYRDQVVEMTSTDSEAESETVRNGSPDASSTASDSPTPTNSVQDRSWAVTGAWQGLVSEEQRQLLGTEEESSDKHSSEDDDDTEMSNEVWTITNEQREYYTNQFRSLQPDTNALLAGPVARMFFEKSRLPVHELRKIWQLADVTKDGALSLHEFNTAMHLVVLRRNQIELPDMLPPTLLPTASAGNETPISTSSPDTEPILTLTSSPQSKENAAAAITTTTTQAAKEWTKFVDSPTSSSSVSSPGPKPVNFDFQKVTLDKDSSIVHPVPLRLTPEVASNNCQLLDDLHHHHHHHQTDGLSELLHSPKKFLDMNAMQNLGVINAAASQPNNNNSSAAIIQRPQPKKISIPGPGAIPPPPPTSQGSIEEGGPQQQQQQPISLPAFPPPKKEKPPPPPPRPFKTHGRSSSLDLNRLTKLGAPPMIPPRVSPNIQSAPKKKLINQKSEGGEDGSTNQPPFADFEQFEKYENVTEGIFPGDMYEAERKKLFAQFCAPEPCDEAAPPRKHGAFEIYRKPNHQPQQQPILKGKESPVTTTNTVEDKAKWQLFKQLQEENTVLLRICQELSQELAELKEERMTLKVRLEKQLNGG